MKFIAPRGTKDLFDEELIVTEYVENVCKELAKTFSIKEIRTPTFEHTDVFLRGVGETTDIVSKEMYTFNDKSDRSITLKPEGTAGTTRAYLENKLYAGTMPIKMFYLTSCFRYEKPQAGRLREFHQFGVEYFGSYEPECEIEVIAFADTLLKKLGLKNVKLHINSLGGNECRKKYNESVINFVSSNLDNLCDTCKDRAEKNPLRILDCKNPNCQEILKDAPNIVDILGEDCKKHFDDVKAGLKMLGIDFIEDKNLVRGLDYYTKTVFEFVSDEIGSQGTVLGGGRYDNLIGEYGGADTGAVGFGLGIERIVMLVMQNRKDEFLKNTPDIFIGSIGEKESYFALNLAQNLRLKGIKAESDLLKKSLKNQMKYADKSGAKFSTIIGEDELKTNRVTVKNMTDGTKNEMDIDNIFDFLS